MSTGFPVGELTKVTESPFVVDPISVLVFNDHPVFRSSLSWKVEPGSNLRVVADVPSVYETARLIDELEPSVVLVELRIGDGNSEGIESITSLAEHVSTTPIVVTTDHCSRSFVARLMTAGATAVVQKSTNTQALVDAILNAVNMQRSQNPAA